MRLTCPSCEAQYEVDAALIPASGRDVQCSNCGKTWFQEAVTPARLAPETRVAQRPETASRDEAHDEPVGSGAERRDAHAEGSGDGLGEDAASFFAGSRAAGFEDEDALNDAAPLAAMVQASARGHGLEEPEDEQRRDGDGAPRGKGSASDGVHGEEAPGVDAHGDVVAEQAKGDDHADRDEAEETLEETVTLVDERDRSPDARASGADDGEPGDEDDAAGAPPHALPERPGIDAAVLGILKEEADREIAARRAEAAAMESQPELGLAEPRTARASAVAAAADPAAAPGRKALLPDIDEINSTLTATSDRADGAIDEDLPPEVAQKRRSGFRLGFSLLLFVTAALILIYLFAPQLGAAVPALEPALAGYVDWANGVRQGVDGYLERTVNSLTTFLIELSS